MPCLPFRRSIVIAAILAASAAFAGADIVKCIDLHGKVTLTDAQCGDTVQTTVAQAAAAPAPAASPDRKAGQLAIQAAAPIARRAAPQRSIYAPRTDKPLSRDVETLKAARLSMQVLDGASATARQQRLARLN